MVDAQVCAWHWLVYTLHLGVLWLSTMKRDSFVVSFLRFALEGWCKGSDVGNPVDRKRLYLGFMFCLGAEDPSPPTTQ